MTGLLALISTAAAIGGLPQLPARGLALETRAGVQLQSLSGKPLVNLAGLDLASDQVRAHRLVLRDRAGRLLVLDGRRLRRTAFQRGCRSTDVAVIVCAHTIRRDGRVVARAPSRIGHWVWAELAPGGGSLLAQWSAECEVPVAYLVTHGKRHAYGPESGALGWLPSGEALIHFPNGPCGRSITARGIYAVARDGKRRLILRTKRFAQYEMWGG